MIGKILGAHSNLSGTLDYVMGKDQAVVVGGSVEPGTPARTSERMVGAVPPLADLKVAVFHGVLALAPEESHAITDEKWNAIGQEWMADLGYQNTPYVMVKHSDTDHEHIHIVGLGVDQLTGKRVGRWQDRVKSQKSLAKLERRFGLRVVHERPGVAVQGANRKAPTMSELAAQGAQRAPWAPGAALPRDEVWKALDAVPKATMAAWMRELETHGVRALPNVSATSDKVSGLRYVHLESGATWTGGELGKHAQLPHLRAQGLKDGGLQLVRGGVAQNAVENGFPSRYSEADRKAWVGGDLGLLLRESMKNKMRDVVRQSLAGPMVEPMAVPDWVRALGDAGVQVDVVTNRKQDLVGFRFRFEKSPKISFKGSELGKSFTLKGLQAQGLSDVQVRGLGGGPGRGRPGRTAKQAVRRSVPGASDAPDASDASGKGVDSPRAGKHAVRVGVGRRTGASLLHAARQLDAGRSSDEDAWGRALGNVAQLAEEMSKPVSPPTQREYLVHHDGLAGLASGPIHSASAHERTRAMRATLEALGASRYRLFAKPQRGELEQLGEGSNRLWAAAEVLQSHEMLAKHNEAGADIYITPVDDRYHYLVLGFQEDKLSRVLDDAHRPALLQRATPWSMEAILKVPVDERPEEVTKLVRSLNDQYGNRLAAVTFEADQPFHLAGFANRNPLCVRSNDHATFVQVLAAPGGVDEQTQHLIQQEREAQERQARLVAEARARAQAHEEWLDAHQALVADYSKHRGRIERSLASKVRDIDPDQVDFRVAARLHRDGHDVEEVAQALKRLSSDLEQRHDDPQAYAAEASKRAFDTRQYYRRRQCTRDRDDDLPGM